MLINSTCPLVTFHSTLLPEHEKQRTGKKGSAVTRHFSESTHILSGGERWPLPTGGTGNVTKKGLTKWQMLHWRGVISVWEETVGSGFSLWKKILCTQSCRNEWMSIDSVNRVRRRCVLQMSKIFRFIHWNWKQAKEKGDCLKRYWQGLENWWVENKTFITKQCFSSSVQKPSQQAGKGTCLANLRQYLQYLEICHLKH